MTGLAQPCDVGIQRPYKLSIKKSQLNDIIEETLAHLKNEGDPATFKLDTRIKTLRDPSVSWFVKAWNDINKPALVKKAFEHCAVRGGFNLGFDSITSSAALRVLRDLPRTDPVLWNKIKADCVIMNEDDDYPVHVASDDECPFSDDELLATEITGMTPRSSPLL
ncbi:hypothetical protein OF83DRAFT_595413 [Amylostereum chailletii]|nr:hypothetical protein OF83DRAFT_595413 [Amylostereum chailletii]